MFVSSTYLGASCKLAKCYIYLLIEDYKFGFKDFQEDVIKAVQKLGKRTGEITAVFTPLDICEEEISLEVQQTIQPFISRKGLEKKNPGLFIIRTPLQDFNGEKDDYVYIGLLSLKKRKSPEIVGAYFKALEETIIEADDPLHSIKNLKRSGFVDKLKGLSSNLSLTLGRTLGGITWTLGDLERMADPFIEARIKND